MKKLLSLLCVFALLLSLTGAAFAEDIAKTDSAEEAGTVETIGTEAAAAEVPAEEAAEEKTGISVGRVQEYAVGGSYYINEDLGIGIPLLGWTVLSEEELAQIFVAAGQVMSDDWSESVNALLESGQTAYLMAATRPCETIENGSESIQILVEDLAVLGVEMTEEEYAEASVQNGIASLEGSEVTAETIATDTVVFGVAQHPAVELALTYGETVIYELMVVQQVDHYMVTYIFTVESEDHLSDLLESAAPIIDYRSAIDPDLYEGSWCTVCGAFDMYLPADWTEQTDLEDVESYVYFVSTNADKTMASVVMYLPITELMESLNIAEEAVPETNMLEAACEGSDHAHMLLNDIPAALMVDEDSDAAYVMFQTEDGGLVVVAFTPYSDTDVTAYANNMMCSISKIGA